MNFAKKISKSSQSSHNVPNLKTFNVKKEYGDEIKQIAKQLEATIKSKQLLNGCIENKDFCRGFIVVEKVIENSDILILGKRPTWYREHDKYQKNIVEYWCPVLPKNEDCCNSNQRFKDFLKNKYQLKVEEEFIFTLFDHYFNNNEYLINLSFSFMDLYWLRCSGEELNKLLKDPDTKDILKKQLNITLEIIKKIKPYAILFISDAHEILTDEEKKQIEEHLILHKIKIHEFSTYPDLFMSDGDIKKIYDFIKNQGKI
jgi:hypothetical protein